MPTCILLTVSLKPVDFSKNRMAPANLALFGLLALSIWSLYKMVLSPRVPPKAPELSAVVAKQLQTKGWRVSKILGARTSHNASTSKGVGLVGMSDAAGDSIRMVLAPVRMRGFSLLGIKDIRAFGTAEKPLFGKTLTIQPDQFEIAQDPSGRKYLSTCITKAGVASNKPLTLRDAIKTEKISTNRRIEILLGLKPPRDWTCLFVQVSTTASNKQLLEVWRSIRPVVTRNWAQG